MSRSRPRVNGTRSPSTTASRSMKPRPASCARRSRRRKPEAPPSHHGNHKRLDMTFSLATIKHNGKPTPVIEVDEQYYPLSTAAPQLLQLDPNRGLMNLFNDWAKSEAALVALADSLRKSKAGAIAKAPATSDFMTPLQYPNKLVLGGANYYEHMHKDAKMPDFRKENAIPVFFLKAPTTSLVGCGKTVRYPTQSTKFDWEVELAVIMGKKARNIDVKNALG